MLAAVNMFFSKSLCDCNPDGNKLPWTVELKEELYYGNVVVGVKIDNLFDITALGCFVYGWKYHSTGSIYQVTNRRCNKILIPVFEAFL